MVVPRSGGTFGAGSRRSGYGPMMVLALLAVVVVTRVTPVEATAAKKGDSIITEYRLPEAVSAPSGIVVDVPGRVWFTEKIGKSLTMFDPEGKQFEVHTLPDTWKGIGPLRIALAPDGSIWFTVRRWADTETPTNLLGRYTPASNRFDRFDLPDGMVPEDLVVADDGSVWFLDPDSNRLHRFQPETAALESHAIPTANGYPRRLVLDGQGALWFAQSNINGIAHFDPVGKRFQEYRIPTPFANPGAVAVDGADNVWFVEMTANRIGVFYPSMQRFDEAMVPTARGLPNAIAADAGGNIWFLEYRGNKVGLFLPKAAAFHEFTIPTYDSQPGEMALDRSRNRLWFSQASTESKKLGLLDIERALAASAHPQPELDKSAGGIAQRAADGKRSRDMVRILITIMMVIVFVAGYLYYRRFNKVSP